MEGVKSPLIPSYEGGRLKKGRGGRFLKERLYLF
jgi:hypothetical protein